VKAQRLGSGVKGGCHFLLTLNLNRNLNLALNLLS